MTSKHSLPALFWTMVLLCTLFSMRYARADSSSLVLMGDSIIQQMAPVQSRLPAPFSRATNLGVSGEVVAQIAAHVRSIPSTATHVLVEGGVNDLARGGSASDVIKGYAAILHSIPRDKRIIVVGILPVDEALIPPGVRTLLNNSRIAAINAQLVSLCASLPNCTPAHALMSMDMSGKTMDGIHLKAATYREWPGLLATTLGDLGRAGD
jgi:lysophospholipase L1-like esterase